MSNNEAARSSEVANALIIHDLLMPDEAYSQIADFWRKELGRDDVVVHPNVWYPSSYEGASKEAAAEAAKVARGISDVLGGVFHSDPRKFGRLAAASIGDPHNTLGVSVCGFGMSPATLDALRKELAEEANARLDRVDSPHRI